MEMLQTKGRWMQFGGDDAERALQRAVPHSSTCHWQEECDLLANASGCCHSGCALPESWCMRLPEYAVPACQ